MSLGPLAVVLLLPVALLVGLRTNRWKRVIVLGGAVAISALLFPTAAIVIVAVALVSLIAGAVVLGTGVHSGGRPTGSLSVAELVAGGLALRWLRRRQVRRWADSWARLVRPPKF